MTPEHEAELRRKYPRLYSEPYLHGDGHMRCGDGWFGVVHRLSLLLELEIAEMPEAEQPHYRADFVKEKFGTLTFGMSKTTPVMIEMISEAEHESAETCEHCGKPGRLRSGGWIRTLCDECEAVPMRRKAEPKP